jgi:hypothetical protein
MNGPSQHGGLRRPGVAHSMERRPGVAHGMTS